MCFVVALVIWDISSIFLSATIGHKMARCYEADEYKELKSVVQNLVTQFREIETKKSDHSSTERESKNIREASKQLVELADSVNTRPLPSTKEVDLTDEQRRLVRNMSKKSEAIETDNIDIEELKQLLATLRELTFNKVDTTPVTWRPESTKQGESNGR